MTGAAIHVAVPRAVDRRGRTATAGDDAWVRSLIEQVLFTAPGERVNRPDFGAGVAQLLFAGNDATLAAATQVTVKGALQAWLGDLVEVREVRVGGDEATLDVTVAYVPRRGGDAGTVTVATFRGPR
jgi:phage baseplate assembly protein W